MFRTARHSGDFGFLLRSSLLKPGVTETALSPGSHQPDQYASETHLPSAKFNFIYRLLIDLGLSYYLFLLSRYRLPCFRWLAPYCILLLFALFISWSFIFF